MCPLGPGPDTENENENRSLSLAENENDSGQPSFSFSFSKTGHNSVRTPGTVPEVRQEVWTSEETRKPGRGLVPGFLVSLEAVVRI